MKFRLKLYIILIYSIMAIPILLADETQNSLTLENIYKEEVFKLNQFGPSVWFEDGSGYTTLEKSDEFPDAKDIIKYNPKSGERSILVNVSQLIPKNKEHPLLISDYQWSADGKKLMVFSNTKRVWRYETKGDYYVLNIDSGELY